MTSLRYVRSVGLPGPDVVHPLILPRKTLGYDLVVDGLRLQSVGKLLAIVRYTPVPVELFAVNITSADLVWLLCAGWILTRGALDLVPM